MAQPNREPVRRGSSSSWRALHPSRGDARYGFCGGSEKRDGDSQLDKGLSGKTSDSVATVDAGEGKNGGLKAVLLKKVLIFATAAIAANKGS